MSNYDNPQLRYSCFSEASLVSHSHPRSLSLMWGIMLAAWGWPWVLPPGVGSEYSAGARSSLSDITSS